MTNYVVRVLFKIRAADRYRRHRVEHKSVKQLLCNRLIHTNRRRDEPRGRVRHAVVFQKSLQHAVFALAAVTAYKRDVGRFLFEKQHTLSCVKRTVDKPYSRCFFKVRIFKKTDVGHQVGRIKTAVLHIYG